MSEDPETLRSVADDELSITLQDCSKSDLVEATWQVLKPYYKVRPVPIRTFIEDPHFLGAYFKGNRKFYPFWMQKLEQIYPSEFHSQYHELIWDLPIGAGKSLSSTSIILYEIYKLQCLKNPHSFYVLADGTRIVFCIFSATLSLSTDVNWEYFENLLTAAPYFKEHCPLPGGKKLTSKDSVVFPGDIAIDLGSSAIHALGKAVFGAVLDEANFQRVASRQAQEGYLQLKRRRESRFLSVGGSVPGKLILLSSPKLATDFLEEQKKVSRLIPSVDIIENTPIWDIVRGTDKDIYSGKKFQVFVGTKTHDPFIITPESPDPADPSRVVGVPIEHKDSFDGDLPSALRDIMGMAISGAMSFITSPQKLTMACTMRNRSTMEVISLDFNENGDKIWEYLDHTYFSRLPFPEAHRFIHLDMAKNQDRLGLASVFAITDSETLGEDNRVDASMGDTIQKRERMYYVELLLYIQAKPNSQIPLFKIRDLILYLKKQGYPILRVSADQYQSLHLLQELEVQGLEVKNISVDKSRTPYTATRELIYRGKLLLPNHSLMIKEFLGLLDDSEKIDHPPSSSKDGTDAIAGAVWSALTSDIILRPNARFPKDLTSKPGKHLEKLVAGARRREAIDSMARRLFIQPGIRSTR